MGWWGAWLAAAFAADFAAAPAGGVDVVIVPGCPTLPDGRPSECQWRRAAWAATLYDRGLARNFVTSGGAAYTPYVEASVMADALVALGVPAEVVFRETQSLHTDQNTGYSLRVADTLGFRTVGAASEAGQANAMCRMAMRWDRPCTPFALEEPAVAERLARRPEVVAEAIPRERWIAEHRTPKMATNANYLSFMYYTGVILKATLTGARLPEPPGPEPSLDRR